MRSYIIVTILQIAANRNSASRIALVRWYWPLAPVERVDRPRRDVLAILRLEILVDVGVRTPREALRADLA